MGSRARVMLPGRHAYIQLRQLDASGAPMQRRVRSEQLQADDADEADRGSLLGQRLRQRHQLQRLCV